MLKIRLQRVGRKNDPSYRVVAIDSKKGPKSGNNIEIIGTYDPKSGNTKVKGKRVEYWISKGAQMSDTVNNMLIKKGIIKGKKKHVSRGKKNTRTPEVEEVKEIPTDATTSEPVKQEASTLIEETSESVVVPKVAEEATEATTVAPTVTEPKA